MHKQAFPLFGTHSPQVQALLQTRFPHGSLFAQADLSPGVQTCCTEQLDQAL
jgi:hypothetical protein